MQKTKSLFLLFLLLSISIVTVLIYVPTVEGGSPYEDFTTYTKGGTDQARISVTETRTTVTTLGEDEEAYLYYDKGTGYFSGNFEHYLDVKITAQSGLGAKWVFWTLSEGYGSLIDWVSGGHDGIAVFVQKAGSPYLKMYERYDGGSHYSGIHYISLNVVYYLVISRTSTSFECKIYGDSDRTNLIKTLSITLQSVVSYRYVQSSSWEGSDPDTTSGYCEYFWIRIFYTVTVYFNDGGQFRIDNATMSNETSLEVVNGSVFELCAVTKNSSYVFQSFNWTGSSSTSNPYNYTVTANMTIWLIFGLCSGECPVKPYFPHLGHNSSLGGNTTLLYTRIKTDSGTLSYARWCHNNTGSYVNGSWLALSGSQDDINLTISLGTDYDDIIGFKVYANNSLGNMAESKTTFLFGVDDPPIKEGVNFPVLFVGASIVFGLIGFVLYLSRKKKP